MIGVVIRVEALSDFKKQLEALSQVKEPLKVYAIVHQHTHEHVDLMLEFPSLRIEVIQTTKMGFSAFQFVANHVKETYLCFLLPHDIPLPESFHIRYELLDADHSIDVVFGDVLWQSQLTGEEVHWLKERSFLSFFAPTVRANYGQCYEFNESFFEFALQYFPQVWLSSALFRRQSFVTHKGFQSEYGECADLLLWFRLAKNGKMVYWDDVFSRYKAYRKAFFPYSRHFFEHAMRLFSHLPKLLKITPQQKKHVEKRLAEYQHVYAIWLWRHHQKIKSIQLFLHVLRSNPKRYLKYVLEHALKRTKIDHLKMKREQLQRMRSSLLED